MKLKKEFNRELVSYAFKLVEHQKESAVAIRKILARVGKEYHLDGVYIKTPQYLYAWGEIAAEEKDTYRFPLQSHDKSLGSVVLIDHTKKHEWANGEKETLKILGTIITAYLFKIRAYEEAQEQIRLLSEHDSKTGLLRYEYFLQDIDMRIKEGNAQKVIIYTDFGNFRYLNDNFGYEKGNQVLYEFAEHIRKIKADFVAASRLYSDHFIVYLEFEKAVTNEELLKTIKCSNQAFIREEKQNFPEISLLLYSGIYFIDDQKDYGEDAISKANLARKNVRNFAESNSIVFDEKMKKCAEAQAEYTSRLKNAIEHGDLMVYYQPKISCNAHELIGAEALIRWQRPDGSMICPDEFIPYLEKNGSIIMLDYFVYESVCMAISERLKAGKKVVPISVNVSRVHAREKNIVLFVEYLLDKYKIPPKLLEFEITESLYMEDIEAARQMVTRLRDMGVCISMDDFGTGYSSLNVLKYLPIDILKIDRSFIQMEGEREIENIIVENVIRMAKELGMSVICEGVEREEQIDFLERTGCDYMQGFYFSKPVCEAEFVKLLVESSESGE